MICKNCGQPIGEGDLFCGNCGAKVEPDFINSKDEDKNDDAKQNSNAPANESEGIDPYSYVNNENKNTEADKDIPNQDFGNGRKAPTPTSTPTTKPTPKPTPKYDYKKENNASNVKTIRINKKAAIIVFVVLVVLIVGAVAGYFIWNSIPVKINLSDYISSSVYNDAARKQYYSENGYENSDYETGDYYDSDYSDEYIGEDSEDDSYMGDIYNNFEIGPGLCVYGYNAYATVYEEELMNVVDWESLKNDVDEQLSKKKKIGGEHLTFNDIVDSDSFDFTVDKFENLKNDDIVTVSVNSFEVDFSGIKVEFNGCDQKYTISDLQVVNAFDPFEYVDLVLYGANGYAYAKCIVNNELNQEIDGIKGFSVSYYDDSTIAVEKDGYIVSKINFSLSSDQQDYDYFKNGDVVTMYCSCSDDLIDSYNIYIANYQKDFTVSGLGEYMTKSSKLSDSDLEKFKKDALNKINDYFNGYDDYSGFKFNSAYLTDLKDKSDEDYYHNSLCMIYSYTITYWDNETETRYLSVQYNNIVINKDGSTAFTPDDYYESVDNSYDSPEEFLTSSFSDSYNVTKVG